MESENVSRRPSLRARRDAARLVILVLSDVLLVTAAGLALGTLIRRSVMGERFANHLASSETPNGRDFIEALFDVRYNF
jgi:hypothetical protein